MTHTVLTTMDLPEKGSMQAVKGDTLQLADGSQFIYHTELGWCYGNVIAKTDPLTGVIIKSGDKTIKTIIPFANRPRVMVVGNSLGRQSVPSLNPDLFTSYLASGAKAGTVALTLNTGGGAMFASGNKIAVQMATGEYHLTTVNGAPVGDVVTLAAPLPKYARSGIGYGGVIKYTSTLPNGLDQDMGIVSAANAVLGSPMQIIQGYGLGGARDIDILKVLERWLAAKRPDIVVFSGLFENVMSAVYAGMYADFVARTVAAARICIKHGATPVFQSIVPTGTAYLNSVTGANFYDAYANYVTNQLPIDVPGACGYTCHGWLNDPTRASTTQRIPIASYVDAAGIHPLQSKRFTCVTAVDAAGKSVVSQLAAILDALGYGDFVDTGLADQSIGANPYLTGTTGAKNDSAGGVTTAGPGVPTGDYVGSNGAGTVCTISRNVDGSLKLVGSFSSASASTNVVYRKGLLGPDITDVYGSDQSGALRGLVKFRVNAATNIAAIYPKISFNTTIDCIGTAGAIAGTAQDTALIGLPVTLETTDMMLPAAADRERIDIVIQPVAGGSASFDIDLIFVSALPGNPHAIVI